MNEIISVKLDDLKLQEKNVRLHPSVQIREYRRSLQMFGQTKNAVIDEDNNVLIGNGLVMAAREEGWEEIFAIRRADLSENDKLKLMIGDNKIFGLGIENLDVVDEIFQILKHDLSIPGYDEATLAAMVAEAKDVTETIADFGRLDDNTIATIQNRSVPSISSASQPTMPSSEEKNASTTDYIPSQGQATEHETPTLDAPDPNDHIKIRCPKCSCILWVRKE